jgi:hypothetical protein
VRSVCYQKLITQITQWKKKLAVSGKVTNASNSRRGRGAAATAGSIRSQSALFIFERYRGALRLRSAAASSDIRSYVFPLAT